MPQTSKKELPTLPHSAEYERAALGIGVLDNAMLSRLAELTSADFFLQSNREIFAEIMYLHTNQVPVNIVTLAQRLIDQGRLDFIGGASYVASLTDNVVLESDHA